MYTKYRHTHTHTLSLSGFATRSPETIILRCWRVRQARLGVVSIKAGCVVQIPPVLSVGQAHRNPPRVRETLSNSVEYRGEWLEWRPRPSAVDQLLVPGRSPWKNFYVVWRGRAPGRNYRWYDVRNSLAGFKDPVYKDLTLSRRLGTLAPASALTDC